MALLDPATLPRLHGSEDTASRSVVALGELANRIGGAWRRPTTGA
ncbi:MAG: hypothetical protein ACJ72E_09155 [Marmoricola sp.]